MLERLAFFLCALPLAIPLIAGLGLLLSHGAGSHGLLVWTAQPFTRALLLQLTVTAVVATTVPLVLWDERYVLFWTRSHTWGAVAFGALVATALVAPDPTYAIFSDTERADGIVFLAHVGLYALALSWIVRDRARWMACARTAVVLGIATLVTLVLDAAVQGRPLLAVPTWISQGSAVLGNVNFFAHYVLLLLGFQAFGLLMPLTSVTRNASRRDWLVGFLLLGVLVLSGSATAMLLGAALLIATGWWTHRWRTYAVVCTGCAFLLSVVLIRGSSMIAAPVESLMVSMAIRLQLWSGALATLVRERLLTGYGWGNLDLLWSAVPVDVFAATYGPYQQLRYDRMHNMILEWFAAAGIFGLLVMLLAYGRVLIGSARRWYTVHTPTWRAWTIVCVVACAYLFFNFDTLMSWLLGALLLVGWMLEAAEPQRMFLPQRAAVRYGIAVCIVVAAVAAAFPLTIQPLRAATYRMRAEIVVTTFEAQPQRVELIEQARAFLAQAAAIRHPYTMFTRDVLDTGMRLAAQPLPDGARDELLGELLREADALIAAHPENPHPYHRKAWVYGRFGDRDAEAAALRQAVARAPSNGALRFQLAQVELRRHNFHAAREIFRALADEGLFVNATRFHLAALAIWDGDRVGGRRAVSRAIPSYRPTNAEWQVLTAAQQEAGASSEEILRWYERLQGYAAGRVPDAEIARLREQIDTAE